MYISTNWNVPSKNEPVNELLLSTLQWYAVDLYSQTSRKLEY